MKGLNTRESVRVKWDSLKNFFRLWWSSTSEQRTLIFFPRYLRRFFFTDLADSLSGFLGGFAGVGFDYDRCDLHSLSFVWGVRLGRAILGVEIVEYFEWVTCWDSVVEWRDFIRVLSSGACRTSSGFLGLLNFGWRRRVQWHFGFRLSSFLRGFFIPLSHDG